MVSHLSVSMVANYSLVGLACFQIKRQQLMNEERARQVKAGERAKEDFYDIKTSRIDGY